MWERFGFYGMRALLTLYLTKHFLFSDRTASGIYGGTAAMVYLTPVIGGLLADRYLGSKRSVKFGALVMALGYFLMCFGGEPVQPWANIDGVRHEVVQENVVDRPSASGQRASLCGDRAAKTADPWRSRRHDFAARTDGPMAMSCGMSRPASLNRAATVRRISPR